MRIPYGRQWIDEEDIQAVSEILKNDFITTGPQIKKFEEKVAKYVGAKYAVAFNSGTSALHGAYFALGLKKGDEIITSPITFVATSNAAIYLGGIPKFVDIDKDTYCIDINKIEEAITDKTKVIVPVSYAGYPVDIDKINQIAKKYNLKVIEDAAHALGAIRNGIKVGSQADMTMFSFHPVKHITTGEGGMIVTNNKEYYEKMRIFRSHGTLTPDTFPKNTGAWYYEQHYLGYNYRLTDIQAALGLSQLNKLENFLKRRNEIANIYYKELKDIHQLKLPLNNVDRHAFHLFPILLKNEIIREKTYNKLREKNILVQVHYIPVHLQPYYKNNYGYKQGDFKVAEDFYNRELSIPMYPKMTDEELSYVIKEIKNIIK